MKIENLNISENNFEQCLKCTVCTAYCPVVAAGADYPGPKQAGPDGERYRLKNPAYFDETLKRCLNCKRCEMACPHGVNIGDIIQKARIKHSHSKPKFRDMLLANTDFMGKMATMVAPIVNTSLKLTPVKWAMDAVLAVDKHRSFPAYSSQKFETWFNRKAAANQDNFKKHVSFFHGCYVNYNFPKLGQDLVKILNAVGYGVHLLDEEKCCGVALIANGMPKQAKEQGEFNVASMRAAVKKGHKVLTVGSTCTFTMRDEYAHILEIDNSDVRDSITLATRFLAQLVDKGEIKLAFRSDYKKRLAYHTACHMAKLGWSIYSQSLLRMIPGVELHILESQCCGIAGTYGFKKENYETSQAIGSTLFDAIKKESPDYVVTECETCKWQIEMSTGFEVMNPVSVIADALDVEATEKLNQK